MQLFNEHIFTSSIYSMHAGMYDTIAQPCDDTILNYTRISEWKALISEILDSLCLMSPAKS